MSTEPQVDATAAATGTDRITDVTPFEAKLAWDTIEEPNCGKVADHFKKQGRLLSREAVYLWKKSNWRVDPKEYQGKIADLLLATGLDTTLSDKVRDAKLNGLLRLMTDANLLQSTYRSAMAASIKASLAIARSSAKLAMEAPQSMGTGIQRSAAAIPLAVAGMQRMELLDQRTTQIKGAIEASGVPQDEESDTSDPLAVELAAYKREATLQ
jgi:hypothetical protein